jgi:hypothetical protein
MLKKIKSKQNSGKILSVRALRFYCDLQYNFFFVFTDNNFRKNVLNEIKILFEIYLISLEFTYNLITFSFVVDIGSKSCE